MAPPAPCLARLSPAADELVSPIVEDLARAMALDADTASVSADSAAAVRGRAHARIEHIFPDASEGADEALAALARIDIGEHASEDLACVLIARGSRVLPLLKRFERCAPAGAGWTTPAALLLEPELVGDLIEDVFGGLECEDGIWG